MAASAELKKLFTERVTLSPSGGTSWLQVRLSSKGLGDDQMVSLGRFLDTMLGSSSGQSGSSGEVCANVELAENQIGSTGLAAVLDALQRHSVNCKCLKVYKNKITDEGGARLAQMVSRQPSSVEELHLSHNMLTGKSLIALCMALGKHEGYPLLGRNRVYIPCWLRMEYNHIARPQDAVDLLRRDGEVPVCTADNRDDCGPWRCSLAGKTKNGVPKVHLFTITVQCRSRVTVQDDTELREEIRRWGGRAGPPAPSTRLPAARAPTASSGPGGASPSARVAPTKASGAAPASGGRVWDIHGLGRGAGGPAASQSPSSGGWAAVAASPPAARDPAANRPNGWPALESDADPASAKAAGGDKPTGDPFRLGQEVNAAASPARQRSPAGADQAPAQEATEAHSTAERCATRESAAPAASPASQAAAAAPVQSAAAATQEDAERVSMVLDDTGKRRIAPEQLEGREGSSSQFVCSLCSFVMVRPVMTSCSHLFCDACFRTWVAEQVAKHKSRANSGGKVPFLPCPADGCPAQLRTQDIGALDKAAGNNGAAQLLQRLRNNLRVRCVHHVDHFGCYFGADAETISRSMHVTCSWIGDLPSYDDHVQKMCPVEQRILAGGAAAVGDGMEPICDAGSDSGAAAAEQGVDPAAANGSLGASSRADNTIAEGGEVRVARYDYVPQESDQAQIALKANDLVRVFVVTDSGWAAGVRLSRRTKEEVGEAGWFPAAYLSPAGAVAAEAA